MDIMSPEKRSAVMSRIRSKGTTPEKYMATLLAAGGLVFQEHVRGMAGTPDIVFEDDNLAVFIEGDFWHGWRFPIWQHRLSDRWRAKIAKTRERDTQNHNRLRYLGWHVLRIWEHQIESDVIRCVTRVANLVGSQRFNTSEAERCLAELPPLKKRNRLPKP
jgi:DNA mismatch endonuclease (patch repair protein)